MSLFLEILELPEEPDVILEEKPHVVDTELQHGKALDTHSKSKT